MSGQTRRDALVGGVALSVLGCAGGGSDPVRPAAASPTPPPAPPRAAQTLPGKCETFLPEPDTGKGPVAFAASPEWFRRTPTLWVPTAETAGAGVIMLSDEDRFALSARIDSFRRLPELLDTAESLGTPAVYLVDWYEPAPGDAPEAAWRNKGDWIPRSDMGGEEAFKKGIAAINARGGRVILYAEAFAFAKTAEIGKSKGEAWSIRQADGQPLVEPYPKTWKLCPAVEPFARHMEGVARRLGTYGVSGLFLDSYGFQRDLVCTAKDHGHAPGDPKAFNKGCVEVARRMRVAFQSVRKDGVVLCEGPVFQPMFSQVDATFDWGIHKVIERGLWRHQGQTDTYTMGYSLDDLHQLVAVGAKLALSQPSIERPRGKSAAARVAFRRSARKMPGSTEQRHHYAAPMFFEAHMWRNSAILAGIRVPGLDDVAPRRGQMEKHFQDASLLEALLDRLADRARELDEAIGTRADALAAPTAHIRRVSEVRAALSPWVDDEATAAFVDVRAPSAVAWSFTSKRGVALTAVNVGNEPVRLSLPRKGPGRELWTGASVVGGDLELPAHSVRAIVPA